MAKDQRWLSSDLRMSTTVSFPVLFLFRRSVQRMKPGVPSSLPDGTGPMVTGGRQGSCCSSGRRGRGLGRRWSGGGGGRGVGISLPVLCILWVTAWAQNSGPGPVNVARNLPESAYTQSTKQVYTKYPGNAANGNTDGSYSENNCIHTGTGDFNPWWEVDLGKAYYIYNIRIWARDRLASRLYPFTITVDNTQCVYAPQRSGDRSITVNCSQPLRGQVVRITRKYIGVWDYQLNMCEFQIFVCNPGYYGVDCNLRCNDYCSSEGCFMNNGTCISCVNGAWGEQCQNSCGWCDPSTCDMYTGTCTECAPGWYGEQCLTRCPSAHCLDNKCDRHTGVCLACEDNLVGDNCTVCNPGYYGVDCNLRCNDHCSSEGCFMNNGTCISCVNGAWGEQCQNSCGWCDPNTCDMYTGTCTECAPGWYGEQCLTRCPSAHCLDNKCDRHTGVCLACEDNLVGDNCTECSPGMYGDRCQHSCSSKTPGCQLCDRDGQCTACHDDFKPPACTVCREGYYIGGSGNCRTCSSFCASRGCDPLTSNAMVSCPDGRHGDRCKQYCPPSPCVKCHQDTGLCTECDHNLNPPDCIDCIDGYYKQYYYSKNCTKCTWICLNGTWCDKTTGHCPACPPGKKGTKCRDDCKWGTYGLNCSQQCGQCGNHPYCDREDGSCSSCAAGWQMPLCQEGCEDGSYGINCRETCGHCKDGAACDKETGDCLLCEPGWYPHKCQTPCRDGWYGLNCGQRCGRCLNNAACNKTNGYCPCPVGKQPPLCDKDCQNKTYGQDCREKCGHCREGSVCDPVTGHCPQGCQSGWMDNTGLSVHLCDTACPAGLYGVQCNQTCGHCQSDSQCHHVSGECLQGCAEGFTGTHCTTDEESDSGPWTMYVAIISTTLVVVLLAVVFVLVWRSRRTRASGPGEGTHDGRNQPGHIELRPQECSSQGQEEGLYSEIEDASLQQTDQRKAEEDDDGQYIDVGQVSDPPVHASGTRAALLTTSAAAPLKRPPAGGQAAADDPKRETPGGRAYPAKNPPKAGGGGSPPGRQPAVQQPVQAAGDISLATFSKPAHQLDADISEELSGQPQPTYDKAAIYENTREVPKVYEKLQTCSEGMYESYGEAEV
ncbi:uncharacterized protein LOC143285270 [Babylonia areolata]|uniref:uncharacterized protein LOC143285270 n=1 Tax=Babylonia areolata TaxID=304850 RepID=UPI003FD1900A